MERQPGVRLRSRISCCVQDPLEAGLAPSAAEKERGGREAPQMHRAIDRGVKHAAFSGHAWKRNLRKQEVKGAAPERRRPGQVA